MKVLLVDDEEAILEFLEMNLVREGFTVLKASNGADALATLKTQGPNLVLLDVGLPDMDGFEVCRQIRQLCSVPVIMVTARSEDKDKYAGFETGADDYVVKPFNPRELVHRIKAILRRSANPMPGAENRVAYGQITVDILKRRVQAGDRQVDLTPREYDLLVFFLKHPGEIFSRDTILKEVWGSEFMEARSVDVHVKYLREKLKPPFSEALQTVWGKGYKLAEP
ncbi:MAG: response regulator transcription factor [Candidatus Xenobia bacterium]